MAQARTSSAWSPRSSVYPTSRAVAVAGTPSRSSRAACNNSVNSALAVALETPGFSLATTSPLARRGESGGTTCQIVCLYGKRKSLGITPTTVATSLPKRTGLPSTSGSPSNVVAQRSSPIAMVVPSLIVGHRPNSGSTPRSGSASAVTCATLAYKSPRSVPTRRVATATAAMLSNDCACVRQACRSSTVK